MCLVNNHNYYDKSSLSIFIRTTQTGIGSIHFLVHFYWLSVRVEVVFSFLIRNWPINRWYSRFTIITIKSFTLRTLELRLSNKVVSIILSWLWISCSFYFSFSCKGLSWIFYWIFQLIFVRLWLHNRLFRDSLNCINWFRFGMFKKFF